MIWLREYSEQTKPVFKSSHKHFRFFDRPNSGQYVLGPVLKTGDTAFKVILGPKELSYWDES